METCTGLGKQHRARSVCSIAGVLMLAARQPLCEHSSGACEARCVSVSHRRWSNRRHARQSLVRRGRIQAAVFRRSSAGSAAVRHGCRRSAEYFSFSALLVGDVYPFIPAPLPSVSRSPPNLQEYLLEAPDSPRRHEGVAGVAPVYNRTQGAPARRLRMVRARGGGGEIRRHEPCPPLTKLKGSIVGTRGERKEQEACTSRVLFEQEPQSAGLRTPGAARTRR